MGGGEDILSRAVGRVAKVGIYGKEALCRARLRVSHNLCNYKAFMRYVGKSTIGILPYINRQWEVVKISFLEL